MKAEVKRIYETLSSLTREQAENLVERMFYDYHEMADLFSKKLDIYIDALMMAHCPYKVGDAVSLDTPIVIDKTPNAPTIPQALGKIVDISCQLSVDPGSVVEYTYKVSLVYPINSTMSFPEKVLSKKATDEDIRKYLGSVEQFVAYSKWDDAVFSDPEDGDTGSSIN